MNIFKTAVKIAALSFMCAGTTFAEMDEDGWASTYSSMSAFDTNLPFFGNRVSYVEPIIKNLGNVLNSNWYVSANVPKSLTVEFGLPISIIPIGDDDRTYSGIDKTGMPADVPTIFGDHAPMIPDFFGNKAPDYNDPVVYGNETLNGLGVFTYPYLQAAVGIFHARVALRGMILPAVSNLRSFNLFGFGLQYSFGHFFQYMLPPAAQGLDVSLVYGYNTSGIGYRPDDYEGSLDLDVSAHTFDVVIGYKPFNFFEVMMTLGYQSATMESSGHLYQNVKDAIGNTVGTTHEINPNLNVDGNCGFKFGIAVAFQLGSSYHPVVGYDYAGKSSFTTNVLYFRQQFGYDKTPDEIAKEKGYDRNAPKASEPAEEFVNNEPAASETNDGEEAAGNEAESDGFNNEEAPAFQEEESSYDEVPEDSSNLSDGFDD